LGYGDYGVYAEGNLGATGTKSFVEPHPTDPTKTIVYVSLEGPEAGTYFRGRSRIIGGEARIEVPDHFRMVTDEEGLTVQVTPIGPPTLVSVAEVSLDGIIVQGTQDVEFFYMVNGVRKSFKDHQAIQENVTYRPDSPDKPMAEGLAPEQKRILIKTGIYNEDGTVNLDTARTLGWDKAWSK
jgi:hypothetical protein